MHPVFMDDVDETKAGHDNPLDVVEQQAEHVNQDDQPCVVFLDRDDRKAEDGDDGADERDHLQFLDSLSLQTH